MLLKCTLIDKTIECIQYWLQESLYTVLTFYKLGITLSDEKLEVYISNVQNAMRTTLQGVLITKYKAD